MSEATIHLERLPRETLAIHLSGKWQLGKDVPSAEKVLARLTAHPAVKSIVFNTDALSFWDSSILTFLVDILKLSVKEGIQIQRDGLPIGVQQLIDLATAVPKKEDAQKSVIHESFLSRVGSDTILFIKSAGELISFVGDTSVALLRLFFGKSRFLPSDLWLLIQESGVQAVPIVSLISFLVGLILAFVGVLQLKLFGAQIYVADLVSIAMVREMGAIMTGIIMAGRTGAAYAAQLGTMQVNEEIDALETLAIPPMEFLVLPRMLALTLMMPPLVVYADLMGILGGAMVAGIYGIHLTVYLNRVVAALNLYHLFIGLFMGFVFGVLVSLSGCLRGMQCGRSASEVGYATTSAVVTGIVAIIVATAVITVICSFLGI
jgi:phospholipid/cholesterol/gamma-HCH transport system permease protein